MYCFPLSLYSHACVWLVTCHQHKLFVVLVLCIKVQCPLDLHLRNLAIRSSVWCTKEKKTYHVLLVKYVQYRIMFFCAHSASHTLSAHSNLVTFIQRIVTQEKVLTCGFRNVICDFMRSNQVLSAQKVLQEPFVVHWQRIQLNKSGCKHTYIKALRLQKLQLVLLRLHSFLCWSTISKSDVKKRKQRVVVIANANW